MFHYPIEFKLSIEDFSANNLIIANFNSTNLRCDIPKEFNGQARALSPEDYYMFSMISCFFTTFLKLAGDVGLIFSFKNINATSLIDRGENSKPFVKVVSLKFEYTANDTEKFLKLINFTKDNCFILNSVKTEFILDYN